MGNYREFIKDKKRIVIKIGSSSLMHEQTGRLDLLKIEKLVRILIDIKNSGKDVVLVSSGAIAVGRAVIGLCDMPDAFLQALEGGTDILPKQKYSEAMMKEFQQNEALAMQNEEVVKEALSDDYDYVLKEKEDNVTNNIID